MKFRQELKGAAVKVLSTSLCAMTTLALPALAQESEAMKKGEAAYQKMNLKEAAAQFREVIRQEPANAKAHQRLGAVLAAMEDYETAILECKQSIKLDGKNFLPHVVLGQVLANQGKMEEALAEFQEACKLKPTSFRSHMDLGFACTHMAKSTKPSPPTAKQLKSTAKTPPRSSTWACSWLSRANIRRRLKLNSKPSPSISGYRKPISTWEISTPNQAIRSQPCNLSRCSQTCPGIPML
ncbi:MAG: tetratricopeptide repeat protein [Candidatus Competibacteraceae bacterium]|nr:tetratricopeptide repeat protein [Candidatus Competibacteraceae bacterium]